MSKKPFNKGFRRSSAPPKPDPLQLMLEDLKKRYDRIEAEIEALKARWEKRDR